MPNEKQSPLPYEQPAPVTVTRGQMRFLLLLVAIHLLVWIQTTYVPGLSNSLRAWWADRHRKAAEAATIRVRRRPGKCACVARA
jgi:hypothetical protein